MNIKEVQDRSFEILCIIDDICKKEGIPYFLDGGTELGAVREKDIIPWDDDIDIKLDWKYYPAFREAMKRELPTHLHLVEPDAFAPSFYDFTIRILDDRFLLRKETGEDRYYKNLQNRVGVDVFVLFKIPERGIKRTIAYYRMKLIYGKGMGHRRKLDYKEYSTAEKCGVLIMSTIGKMIPAEKTCKHFFKVIDKMHKKPYTALWCNILTPWCIIPSEWMNETTTALLRGREFPIPKKYDLELRAYYGDYMTPRKDPTFHQHLDAEDREVNNVL